MTKEETKQYIDLHLQNVNLRKHCYAVAFVMEALAKRLKGNHNDWYIAGMLHDADFEETKEIPDQHAKRTVEWLTKDGFPHEEILDAILHHNYEHLGLPEPTTPIGWSLFCCDHLTGFLVAVALVRPDPPSHEASEGQAKTKLQQVTLESVMKKWGQSAFAAGTNRKHIALCEEKLGIPLPEFITIALTAMQEHHEELGL